MKEILDALILKKDKAVKIPDDLGTKAKKEILIQIGKAREVEKEI